MVTQGFNQGDKILELAIQHLRAQPIPEFPDPTVELPLDLAQRDPIELKSNAINRKDVAIPGGVRFRSRQPHLRPLQVASPSGLGKLLAKRRLRNCRKPFAA